MERIENNLLRVEADLHGGALFRITDKRSGAELLWQGSPDSWQGRDVVIFPFVARLKDKTYTADGAEYSMNNHGLVRYFDLTVAKKTETYLELGFESSAQTLKQYPFEFMFSVAYRLENDSLYIKYKVQNTGNKTMYFSLGGHAAYNIGCTVGDVDDISGNKLVFAERQTLVRYVLDGEGKFITEESQPLEIEELPLSKELFQKHKTLIYGAVKGGVTLLKRDGSKVVYDLGGAPYTAVWSHERKGGYVCVEPWWGLPDYADCNKELRFKRGINALEAGKTFECGYTATYINR